MTTAKQNALSIQEGGSHYKDMKVQPVEFIHANNIGFCEATAIKYLCRWRKKGGIQDLKKAKHFIDVLIELETREVPIKSFTEFFNYGAAVVSGPYCTSCETTLADFRHDNGPHLAPRYWCSNCAAEAGKDTSEMTLMGGL